jgi:L-cystine transport system permease protein
MGKIDYFSFHRVAEYFPLLLARLHITLIIAVSSLIIGLVFGTIIAAIRLFNIPILKQITTIYISFIRGVPINIQLFIVYFGLPALLNPIFLKVGFDLNLLDAFYFVIITYAFSSSAYLAVVVTAAIQGVDKGQQEAAHSIGMTRGQMFRRVISPQAFHIAIPEFGNAVVSTLKDTSLAFTVGVVDMVGVISSIAARTRHSLEGYVGAAIIYFVFCVLLERIFSSVEKKLKVYK